MPAFARPGGSSWPPARSTPRFGVERSPATRERLDAVVRRAVGVGRPCTSSQSRLTQSALNPAALRFGDEERGVLDARGCPISACGESPTIMNGTSCWSTRKCRFLESLERKRVHPPHRRDVRWRVAVADDLRGALPARGSSRCADEEQRSVARSRPDHAGRLYGARSARKKPGRSATRVGAATTAVGDFTSRTRLRRFAQPLFVPAGTRPRRVGEAQTTAKRLPGVSRQEREGTRIARSGEQHSERQAGEAVAGM